MGQSEAQQKWKKKHYRENIAIYRTKQTLQRQKCKEYVDILKLERGCYKCGYTKCAEALDFHHVDGKKEATISRAITDKWSKVRVDAEILKCDILCANCHREEHFSANLL